MGPTAFRPRPLRGGQIAIACLYVEVVTVPRRILFYLWWEECCGGIARAQCVVCILLRRSSKTKSLFYSHLRTVGMRSQPEGKVCAVVFSIAGTRDLERPGDAQTRRSRRDGFSLRGRSNITGGNLILTNSSNTAHEEPTFMQLLRLCNFSVSKSLRRMSSLA